MNNAEISYRFNALLGEKDHAIRSEGLFELLEATKRLPTPRKNEERLAKIKLENLFSMFARFSKWCAKHDETGDPIFGAATFENGKNLATMLMQVESNRSEPGKNNNNIWRDLHTLCDRALDEYKEIFWLNEEVANIKEETARLQEEIDYYKEGIAYYKEEIKRLENLNN